MAPLRRPRHWKRWLIGLIVVALVLVVGGPFLYFRVIEGPAPAPLRLPKRHASAGGSATVPVDGRWTVAGTSEAGYRVQEVLFGQSNTAVGRTSAITGSFTISGTEVSAGQFTVDMTKVKSDESERDNQFQGRIMDTARFPTSTFVLTQPIQLGSIPAEGTTITESATGELTLHGTTRTVTFPVQARLKGTTISVSGSIPIVFADYGIDNPSGGPATTSNNGILEFLLNFSRS